jgi:hypothetical protein
MGYYTRYALTRRPAKEDLTGLQFVALFGGFMFAMALIFWPCMVCFATMHGKSLATLRDVLSIIGQVLWTAFLGFCFYWWKFKGGRTHVLGTKKSTK